MRRKKNRKYRDADKEEKEYNDNWLEGAIEWIKDCQIAFWEMNHTEIKDFCDDMYLDVEYFIKYYRKDAFAMSKSFGIPKRVIDNYINMFPLKHIDRSKILLPFWSGRFRNWICLPDDNYQYGIDWKIHQYNKFYTVGDLYKSMDKSNPDESKYDDMDIFLMSIKPIVIPDDIMKYGLHLSDSMRDFINNCYDD